MTVPTTSAFPAKKDAKSPGISVREYYAGQALIGLLSGKYRDYDGLAHEETQIAIARLAYSIADAMFAKEASGAKDDEG